jgi:hypothetical protein
MSGYLSIWHLILLCFWNDMVFYTLLVNVGVAYAWIFNVCFVICHGAFLSSSIRWCVLCAMMALIVMLLIICLTIASIITVGPRDCWFFPWLLHEPCRKLHYWSLGLPCLQRCWRWNLLWPWFSCPWAALCWLWNKFQAWVHLCVLTLSLNTFMWLFLTTRPSMPSAPGPLILSAQPTPTWTCLCLRYKPISF